MASRAGSGAPLLSSGGLFNKPRLARPKEHMGHIFEAALDNIQTDRLVLRPFSKADADEAFVEITPALTRYMAFEPPASPAAFELVWREWVRSTDNGSDYTFVIRHVQKGSFIGLAGLHRTAEREPELGIWVSERERGHGYGREAVRVVAEWCDTRFSPAAYRYPVAEANVPSRRIAESLGGRVIGTEKTTKYASVVYRIPAPIRPPG
jgi:RimJ/RimL family protein N-acetyltransferase